METSKALELLKEYLGELKHLRTLRYNNNEQYHWKNKVDVVLEAAFGKDSDEYRKLNPLVSYLGIAGEERKEYLKKLDWWEIRIRQILEKYEILGVETKPAAMAEPPKAPEDYEAKAVGKELELILEGTPDMILECIRSTVEKLNSRGYTYGFRKTSGAPDYARWDKAQFASCTILESERQIGVIKLQLLPNERTLFKIPEPEDWSSPFGNFIGHLLGEFKLLGFVYFEEEKPPFGFKLPHTERNV